MRNISVNFVQKIETYFMFNNLFPRKSCRLWNNVEKSGRNVRPHVK